MRGSFERLGARAPISLTPAGVFQLGGAVRNCALLVSPEDIFAWNPVRSAIDEQELLLFLDGLAGSRGDFLLLGTGAVLKFPPAAFRAEIDRRNLGLEAMDTSAACRTYNVLVGEGRRFAAALLPLLRIKASP
jgi:uncharacterized protein